MKFCTKIIRGALIFFSSFFTEEQIWIYRFGKDWIHDVNLAIFKKEGIATSLKN